MDSNATKALKNQGYAVLQSPTANNTRWVSLLKSQTNALLKFQKSWQSLPTDQFLSDGGHYRYRRYSVFKYRTAEDELELLPHEPHFQSTYRNNMNGGINRDYEPFKQSSIDNASLKSIIYFVSKQISFNAEKEWRIQAHQFRIETSEEESGKPTPEGIHRDGADFILIMLLNRDNISGGLNHIYDKNKKILLETKLSELGDAVLIDDRKVWHGVSEIYPVNKSDVGNRDVLVLTFHHQVLD
ncbi:MAG: 2OG-Fe dioxygenase family protein [Cocleimonas sp.]